MLPSLRWALVPLLLGGCARDCAIQSVEERGYGDSTLDCSNATSKRTGRRCGDVWEVVEVNGCRKKSGEIVNDEILVDTRTSRCFARERAGICFE